MQTNTEVWPIHRRKKAVNRNCPWESPDTDHKPVTGTCSRTKGNYPLQTERKYEHRVSTNRRYHKNLYTDLLGSIIHDSKNDHHFLMDKWNVVHIHIMEYLTIKRVHWYPENIMLSKRRQTQKVPYYMILFMYKISKIGKSIETKSRIVVAKGWGGGKNGELLVMDTGFLSGVMKTFWNYLVWSSSNS